MSWTVRSGSGVELDEEAGAFLLWFLGGEPEPISFETAIVCIPDPRIAFTVAGGPPVEIRSEIGVFRRSPFLHQGQFVHAPRLRRFESECVRVGVPVVRSWSPASSD